MNEKGYSFGLLLVLDNTLAFPCLAARTVLKWKIDKYLIAISISHKDTEVSSLKMSENSGYKNRVTDF